MMKKMKMKDVKKIKIKLEEAKEKIFRKKYVNHFDENEEYKDRNHERLIKHRQKRKNSIFDIIEVIYDILQKKEKK